MAQKRTVIKKLLKFLKTKASFLESFIYLHTAFASKKETKASIIKIENNDTHTIFVGFLELVIDEKR